LNSDVELQRMDPAVLVPAIAGSMLGAYEPDDLLAQVRCPLHLLAAQAALGGAMTAAAVQRFARPRIALGLLSTPGMSFMRRTR
jgi:hypothetical protein